MAQVLVRGTQTGTEVRLFARTGWFGWLGFSRRAIIWPAKVGLAAAKVVVFVAQIGLLRGFRRFGGLVS